MKAFRPVLTLLLFLASCSLLFAQNITTRTNDFEVDFSDSKKLVNTTIPVINWISPVPETNYTQEMKFKIQIEIQSEKPLKNITIYIKENETTASRGMTPSGSRLRSRLSSSRRIATHSSS